MEAGRRRRRRPRARSTSATERRGTRTCQAPSVTSAHEADGHRPGGGGAAGRAASTCLQHIRLGEEAPQSSRSARLPWGGVIACAQRSKRMITDFEVGVPLVSACESRGTSTLVSGK